LRLKEFQKKLKERTKFDIVKGLFQAFTVTVVAVVAVTVFIPKSPVASFDKVKAFSHEIIYQVNVLDEDNIVKSNEVFLVAESQYETFKRPISLGDNYGTFTGLRKDTQYSLKVLYDKGYGEEVLTKTTITTDNPMVAAISDVDIMTSGHMGLYNIAISYGDTVGYSDWQIRFATIYPESEEYSQEVYYNTLVLPMMDETVQLEFYPSNGAVYHIILEAKYEDKMVILDEVSLKAPFSVYGYLYLTDYTEDQVQLYIYGEEQTEVDVLYVLELYQGENLVKKYEYDSLNQFQNDENLIITDLNPDTDYYLFLKAYYRDPITLLETHVLLSEVYVHTLSDSTTPIVIPNSPVVTVENLTAYENYLVYQINLTDYYEIASAGEIRLVMENETELFEEYLDIGNNFGSISGLTANTEYSLKVLFNQGNGDAILHEQLITTNEVLIAAISEFTDLGMGSYQVKLIYGNTTGYSDFQLSYASISDAYPEEFYYDDAYLSSLQASVQIEFYDSLSSRYGLILKAMNNSVLVDIDTVTIDAPYIVGGYLYAEGSSSSSADLNVYLEKSRASDVAFSLQVFSGVILIETINPVVANTMLMYDDMILVDNLSPNTSYSVILSADYRNPDTLKQESLIIYQFFFQTFVEVIPPPNMTATFEDIKVFSNEIIYQINITDADNIIQPGELFMIMTDGYNEFYQMVDLGNNFKSFNGLTPDTSYSLSLIYDLGNGSAEVITETVVTTGALIATVSAFTLSPYSQSMSQIYDVGFSWGDITGYSGWQIRYAVVDPGFEEQAYYDVYAIEPYQLTSEIYFYESYGSEYHIILEALYNGELVIVDETRVSKPFSINLFAYVANSTDTEATLNIYQEVPDQIPVSYTLEVYNGMTLERSIALDMAAIQLAQGNFTIYNLIAETEYTFKIIATFQNPDTGRLENRIIYQETIFTTMPVPA
jgi:hypothetical protein